MTAETKLKPATGSDAGLSGDEQIRLALGELLRLGGRGQTRDLYAALEAAMNAKGFTLSEQGKASLRFFINKVAVEAGYVRPHDRNDPGWVLTESGRAFASSEATPEERA